MGKNWDEIRTLASKYAAENLDSGLNCAEAVFAALIDSGAIDLPAQAVAYATGFGGGGGGTGNTCGALSAAILANNVAHGRKTPHGENGREELRTKHYMRFNNIVSDFTKAAKSPLCREIVNQFEGGYQDEQTRPNCIRICEAAAAIAVDYLRVDPESAENLTYDTAVVGVRNWF